METLNKKITFNLVHIDQEAYFKIDHHDQMSPFFMSIVSDGNHWMFVANNGGLSAGRKNAGFALFPYYTDDKLTEMAETAGCKTIFRTKNTSGATVVWEPYSIRNEGKFSVSRNVYKSTYGNKIIFEEINHDLHLTFRYKWSSSNQFGFVRESSILYSGHEKIEIEMVDGLQNIMPHGVTDYLQSNYSNLVDAYKRSELESVSGLGIYALSAIIVDRAEPSEALKANVVWSLGIQNPVYLISSRQLDGFRSGQALTQEDDLKGGKGAYFVSGAFSLGKNEQKEWMLVANVNQGPSDVVALAEQIKNEKSSLKLLIQKDIQQGTENLKKLVCSADGLQLTSDNRLNARHFSNVMFNIMRGGIFDHNYQIESEDFKKYLAKANKAVTASNQKIIDGLGPVFTYQELNKAVEQSIDVDFKRLAIEYLPLKFSRRHGDPSRPWNRFSINTRSEIDGSKILDYEGNWRDIFQNWETLAHAYPDFIEGMIFKFLNASTFEGYNPYRVTKGGFDWETIEPHDPWSYIGYWGDHQIIYLLKFLEFANDHYPGKINSYFKKDLFVYANVPYKIKSYDEILDNPKDTIVFDEELDRKVRTARDLIGADGALLKQSGGNLHRVNFIEKILATTLAKLSNFIPEGGIWMNTQRPEWNDANNALVGQGVSMVTLYYLRRFFDFFKSVLSDKSIVAAEYEISQELLTFYQAVVQTLDTHKLVLKGKLSDEQRKNILDGLGNAGSAYRLTIYGKSFSGKKSQLQHASLLSFCDTVLTYLEHSIRANQRQDKLYHAYNLMSLSADKKAVNISYLDPMLEGQVAVLSSKYLKAEESIQLLEALRSSSLYRQDQQSYILYPNKELPRFLVKNIIPENQVNQSQLLTQLIKDNNRQVIEKDVKGQYHFNGGFNNAGNLKDALSQLPEKYQSLIASEKALVLSIFEEVFNHKSFTGRSGTFFGYEGLGSIYWHMVSKLGLAVAEVVQEIKSESKSREKLGNHYFEIKKGIGAHKSPENYGAFPTDPYSHTPAHKGAQQPGMTGQVKEDILSRWMELGISIVQGCIHFNPYLLRSDEFLTQETTFEYFDVAGMAKQMNVQKDQFAFTYCQIPIIYSKSEKAHVIINFVDGTSADINELSLHAAVSSKIFNRTGEIASMNVFIPGKFIF